jgi:hypothetical protein
MAENINSYKWICLSITNNGLFTAYLKSDNNIIDGIRGSYPKSNQAIYDAKSTWGNNLPIHWDSYIVDVPAKKVGIL